MAMATSGLAEICRLCMGRDDVMSPIYETRNFAMRVMSVAQVKIRQGDGLPTHICRRCFLRVDAAYDFQEVCWTSDLSLKKKFAYVNPDLDTPTLTQPAPTPPIEDVIVKQEVIDLNNMTDTRQANQSDPMQMEFVSTGTAIVDYNNSTVRRHDPDPVSAPDTSHCPQDTSSLVSESDQDSDTNSDETVYHCPNSNKPALPRRTLTPRSTRRAKRRLVYECSACKKPFRRGELVKVSGSENGVASASGKKRKLTDCVVVLERDASGGSGARSEVRSVKKADVAVQTARVRPEPGAYARADGQEEDDGGGEESRDKVDCFCKELKTMVNPEAISLIESLVTVLKKVLNNTDLRTADTEPSPNILENDYLFADPLPVQASTSGMSHSTIPANQVELVPGSNVYVNRLTIQAILSRAKGNPRLIVRYTLKEIIGNDLKNFSAHGGGKMGNRAVPPEIQNAIQVFAAANTRNMPILTWRQFVSTMNTRIGHERRAEKRRIRAMNKKSRTQTCDMLQDQ